MPFKDDIRQLADLKQQISQKMILLRSTVTFWWIPYWNFTSSFDFDLL